MSQQTPEFEQQQRQLKISAEVEDAIPCLENMADVSLAGLTWTVFGVVETHALAVRARAGRFEVIGRVSSPVFYPPMANRLFGIDAADSVVVEGLSGTMWTHCKMQFGEALKNAD